jgi:putative mRNA 3-end processing factor
VYLHTAAWPGVQVYAHAGCNFPNVATLAHAKPAAGSLIIAPPGAAIAKAAGEVSTGFASGWMQLRGPRRRDNYECGFVISDHADWNDLLRTIEQSGAQRVIATHGNTDALIRYLRESGLDASSFKTEFSGD